MSKEVAKQDIIDSLSNHKVRVKTLKNNIEKRFSRDKESLEVCLEILDLAHSNTSYIRAADDQKMQKEKLQYTDLYCELYVFLIDLKRKNNGNIS